MPHRRQWPNREANRCPLPCLQETDQPRYWSCGPDGTRVLGYRSIGTGPPAALQRLREQVGWLVPRHTITFQLGQIIDAASPAG